MSLARTASIAGIVAVVAIVTVEVVIPLAVTGSSPISGSLDRETITAYYGHPGLEWALGFGLFVVAIPAFLVFAVTTRELAAADERARFLATLGLAFALCAAPIYVVKGAIAASLVVVTGNGLDPLPLFRVYDLVYNGAVYPLEAAYVLGLGLAAAAMGAGASWLRWVTIGTASILFLNGLVLYVGLPSAVAMPGNVLFAIWLAATSVALWRLEPASASRRVTVPA